MAQGAEATPDRTVQGIGIILASVLTMAFADARGEARQRRPDDLADLCRPLACRNPVMVALLSCNSASALKPRAPVWAFLRSVLLVLAWITFYASLPGAAVIRCSGCRLYRADHDRAALRSPDQGTGDHARNGVACCWAFSALSPFCGPAPMPFRGSLCCRSCRPSSMRSPWCLPAANAATRRRWPWHSPFTSRLL